MAQEVRLQYNIPNRVEERKWPYSKRKLERRQSDNVSSISVQIEKITQFTLSLFIARPV